MTAGESGRPSATARHPLSKVPEITVLFWVIKVLSTGMGEATSDYFVFKINPELAVGLGFLAFAAAMVLQFAVRKYMTWVYWLAVVMVAVFGTMVADVIHVRFGVPYAVSTTAFLIALVVIFVVWYATEKTLSIHSIHTRRREFFYWATVIATFALGTAAGDLTATTFHLGYLGSAVLFAVAIAIPALAYLRLRVNAILCFWVAYILTRPLGASIADWLGVPKFRGGLGFGRGPVALAGTILIVGLVAYLAVTHKDVETPGAAPPPTGRRHRAGRWPEDGPRAPDGRWPEDRQWAQDRQRARNGRHRATPAGRPRTGGDEGTAAPPGTGWFGPEE
jgi:uncharacterized membrane-anchored protein